MLVSYLCDNLKKIKEFARENSPYDLAKNVRITGTEDEVVFYCCDGEVAIWKREKTHGKPILGDFSINIFSLFKILKTLSPDSDIGIKLGSNYNIKITGPSCKINVNSLTPDKILELSPNKKWEEATQEDFIEDLQLISLLAVNELFPITYNSKYIYYATPKMVAYKEVKSSIPSFKLTPKVARHIFSDTFTQMCITEKTINCRNKDCEIMLFQTLTKSFEIKGILNNIDKDFKHIVDIRLKDLLEAHNILASLREVEKIESPAIDIDFKPDQITIDCAGSKIEVPCLNIDNISKQMRVPIDHLKSVTSTKEGWEDGKLRILLSLSEYESLVVDKGKGVIFAGGLMK
jgi:hypothetical protein